MVHCESAAVSHILIGVESIDHRSPAIGDWHEYHREHFETLVWFGDGTTRTQDEVDEEGDSFASNS